MESKTGSSVSLRDIVETELQTALDTGLELPVRLTFVDAADFALVLRFGAIGNDLVGRTLAMPAGSLQSHQPLRSPIHVMVADAKGLVRVTTILGNGEHCSLILTPPERVAAPLVDQADATRDKRRDN